MKSSGSDGVITEVTRSLASDSDRHLPGLAFIVTDHCSNSSTVFIISSADVLLLAMIVRSSA